MKSIHSNVLLSVYPVTPQLKECRWGAVSDGARQGTGKVWRGRAAWRELSSGQRSPGCPWRAEGGTCPREAGCQSRLRLTHTHTAGVSFTYTHAFTRAHTRVHAHTSTPVIGHLSATPSGLSVMADWSVPSSRVTRGALGGGTQEPRGLEPCLPGGLCLCVSQHLKQ